MPNPLHQRLYQSGNRSDEIRNPALIDTGRIVHSFSFRRLQGKMQVLGVDQGDFHRTRLTHSSEVASIARSIAGKIKQVVDQDDNKYSELSDYVNPNSYFFDFIRAISLLHDIGHPPFGHGGERALNYLMRNYGGFEGNAQTLRLITDLESNSSSYKGLDLTKRTLIGILKYPRRIPTEDEKNQRIQYITETTNNLHVCLDDWKPKKGYYYTEENYINWIFNGILSDEEKNLFFANTSNNSKYNSLDCSIMNIADDISNAIHDLEDSIYLGIIKKEHLASHELRSALESKIDGIEYDALVANLFSTERGIRKENISNLIHQCIHSIKIYSYDQICHPLFKFYVTLSDEKTTLIEKIRELILEKVINTQETRTFEYGGAQAIMELFYAFERNHELLPEEEKRKINEINEEQEQMRIICDYISGMTDNYAIRLHKRLFGIEPGSIFDKL